MSYYVYRTVELDPLGQFAAPQHARIAAHALATNLRCTVFVFDEMDLQYGYAKNGAKLSLEAAGNACEQEWAAFEDEEEPFLEHEHEGMQKAIHFSCTDAAVALDLATEQAAADYETDHRQHVAASDYLRRMHARTTFDATRLYTLSH